MRRKCVSSTLLILILISVFPRCLAQSDIGYELSAENESYRVLDTLNVNGAIYQIIIYPNNEVILVSGPRLVTDTSTMTQIYKVKAYRDQFAQLSITSDRYGRLYNALDSLYANTKSLNDIMYAVDALMALLGIAGIAISGPGGLVIVIPYATVSLAVHTVISYILNNVGPMKEKALVLKNKLAQMNGAGDYAEVLSLTSDLRSAMSDFNGHLTLTIAGYGNVLYCKALYGIADGIAKVPGGTGTADSVRSYATAIEASQKEIQSFLDWSNSLDVSQIQQSAESQTTSYISLQSARLDARKSDFDNALVNVQNLYSTAQSEISRAGSEGADISYASALMTQAETRISNAKTLADQYLFRSGKDQLPEASSVIQKARKVASAALVIHQAEMKIDDAQNVINQKATAGADVSQATSKLNEAKTALSNAKSSITNDPDVATRYANDAIRYAEEAKNLALSATTPQQTVQPAPEQPSPSPAGPSTPPKPESTLWIVIFILLGLTVVASVLIYRTHSRRKHDIHYVRNQEIEEHATEPPAQPEYFEPRTAPGSLPIYSAGRTSWIVTSATSDALSCPLLPHSGALDHRYILL